MDGRVIVLGNGRLRRDGKRSPPFHKQRSLAQGVHRCWFDDGTDGRRCRRISAPREAAQGWGSLFWYSWLLSTCQQSVMMGVGCGVARVRSPRPCGCYDTVLYQCSHDSLDQPACCRRSVQWQPKCGAHDSARRLRASHGDPVR
jgi:hypothetical protein